MNILITGGAGYVGSACLRHLAARGHRVVAFDDLRKGHAEAVDGNPLIEADIADTGRSLAYVRALLEQRGVAGLRCCVLLDKPSRREVEVPVDFVGFTIEDLFVAGYGIDYAEKYRELPHIVVVD